MAQTKILNSVLCELDLVHIPTDKEIELMLKDIEKHQNQDEIFNPDFDDNWYFENFV